MLIRRLFLLGVAFFALWPCIAMAAPFPIQKRSTLTCLVGNPSFSETLIASNPRLSGRTYAISDAVLWHILFSVKRSMGPISSKKIEFGLPHFEKWEETLDDIIKKVESVAKPGLLAECGVYLNQFSMLYFSTKCTYVLVVGNDNQPFNGHVNIGKFPIHFGSGFSDYPFASPLQADMGAAANAPAVSINIGNTWNVEHQSKGRVFGFMREHIKARNYTGYQWGVNLSHEWKPLSKIVENVSGGIAWVQGLPMIDNVRDHHSIKDFHDGVDLYCHINSGPFKIKLEGLMGEFKDTLKTFWKKEKSAKTSSKSSSKPETDSISSKNSKKKYSFFSSSQSTLVEKAAKISKSADFQYILHGEVSYKLPWKKDSNAVLGYAWGNSGFLTAKKRFFVGFKTSLLENLNCVIGYHIEEGLKKEVDGEMPRGYVNLDSKERYLPLKGRDEEGNKKYDGNWRHSVTVQLSFDI